MSQGPLCPNLTKKVQKEVSQMANRKLSCAMLYRWFKCKLKLPKKTLVPHTPATNSIIKLDQKNYAKLGVVSTRCPAIKKKLVRT